MAALAEATSRIQLFGSVAVPTVHPAITARRAATIDHISNGRFGVNIVSGWQKDEYVKVMKQLWTERDVDFDGQFFQLKGARVLPHPLRKIPLVCAGQSDNGLKIPAENGDYAFIMVDVAATNQKLRQYAEKAGRDVGSYAQCAEQLDELSDIKGTKGIMLIFPECLQGLQEFGENVLPLMDRATLHNEALDRVVEPAAHS